MPLPFKSKPKQTFVEIGDEAIGTLHFPVKWGLTLNEQNLIDEATKNHKGYRKLVLDFADKILKTWETELDRIDVANAILHVVGILRGEHEHQVEVLTHISDKHEKALEKLITSIADEFKIRRGAYIQAAMQYRFDAEDWQIEWAWDIESCPEQGWSKPLAKAIYDQMEADSTGERNKDEEIVSDEDFKGFTPENVKKPQQEMQRELIGAGSSG